MIEDLNRESRNVGLKKNIDKTKIMFSENAETAIRVLDKPLEIVNENTYLGQTLVYEKPEHHLVLERKLIQRAMEMIMMEITPRETKRSTWIRARSKLEDILTTCKKKEKEMVMGKT
ncbi:uncharacterized protein [Palaemon carinicauda]|uniref:uncharacterized protein n=1 Tax=Palaemon carinicauda TaxID=392227 RepID=UPI0035B5FA84